MGHSKALAVAACITTSIVATVCVSKFTPLSSILNFLPTISSSRRHSTDIEGALAELQAFFPAVQLGTDEATLTKFGSSWGSITPSQSPTIVVYVLNTAEVVKIVSIATKYNIIIIPVGGRTSLEGQFTCCSPPLSSSTSSKSTGWKSTSVRPTIHISLERMNKVLNIYEVDQQATVEPGVGWQSLNKHLEENKIPLFFPIDPGPNAHFGGMVAVAGSGTNAVSAGTMKGELIMNMQVVLMNGEILNTRGPLARSKKSTTGWDVGRLFLGSEGTLGIITKLTVRLAPILPLKVALTSFPTVQQAVAAVTEILASGLNPTSLELLDGMSIRGLNLSKFLSEELEERPTVFMRFSSSLPIVLEVALKKVEEIVIRNGANDLRIAKDDEENEKIWAARKNQFWSQQLLIGEGCRTLITDICVPLSRLAEFIDRSELDVAKSGLLAPIVAHIGDSNIHRAILFRLLPGSDSAPVEVAALASALCELAIELEGTVAGEHGIGLSKRKYLEKELGKPTLDLMRRIKNELDPLGLLNPGKVLFEDWEM